MSVKRIYSREDAPRRFPLLEPSDTCQAAAVLGVPHPALLLAPDAGAVEAPGPGHHPGAAGGHCHRQPGAQGGVEGPLVARD